VETLESSELGALGCAMAASVADGQYQDLAAASSAMVRIKQRYEHQSALAGIYDRKYKRFRQFSDQLDALWE
jgi:L-xylulokinase